MMAGNYRLDQWFVGTMAGSRELGLYSIAVAWSEILFYLPTTLVIVQRPYLVRAAAGDAARRTARVFRAGISITAACVLGIVVVAPFLCTVVFGSAFRGSIDDLRVLAFGAFGIMAMKLFGNAMTAQRSPTRASVAAGLAFAATIALDLLLIPRHGGLGAAAASALAYTGGGIASGVLFRRFFGTALRTFVPRSRELLDVAREFARLLARLRPA
jgi:O-antigen/teichoic acid export membrane protein